MRQVQLRAYDRDKKIMVTEKNSDWCVHYNNIAIIYWLHQMVWKIGLFYETMMQYTEVKDEKGVEICEGDICIVSAIKNRSLLNEILCEVFFEKGSFKLKNYKIYDIILLEEVTCNIVGNIYENPELL